MRGTLPRSGEMVTYQFLNGQWHCAICWAQPKHLIGTHLNPRQSHVLTKDHLLVTTLRGELIAVDIHAKPGAKPFRFRTPTGKGIGAAPVVADGQVYFGGDDGYFYVLGGDGKREPVRDATGAIHQPRSKAPAAAGKAITWPSTCGNAGNTSFVNDLDLKPPLRVRWATRGFGHFLAPCIATENDLISVTFGGIITCQEQSTGRLRWRRQMPGLEWGTASGLHCRPAWPCMFLVRLWAHGGHFLSDLRDGQSLWLPLGIGGAAISGTRREVLAGKVALARSKGTPPGTAGLGRGVWKTNLAGRSQRRGQSLHSARSRAVPTAGHTSPPARANGNGSRKATKNAARSWPSTRRYY